MDRSEYAENRRYKSNLTGEYVNCAQWVAEILVKRKAEFQGVVLPYKFWTINGPWKAEFIKQVSQVHNLLKDFDEQAIINFVNNNPKAFSVRPKYNIQRISNEQALLLKNKSEEVTKNIEISDPNKFKKVLSKTTLFGKLNGK